MAKPYESTAFNATVIVEPKGRGGCYLIVDGRTFVLRGGIVKGMRDVAASKRVDGRVDGSAPGAKQNT